MVVRGQFGRKQNEYRYLTYTTIIENSFDKNNAFLGRCFDNTVLLKQSAYRNRGLYLGR